MLGMALVLGIVLKNYVRHDAGARHDANVRHGAGFNMPTRFSETGTLSQYASRSDRYFICMQWRVT